MTTKMAKYLQNLPIFINISQQLIFLPGVAISQFVCIALLRENLTDGSFIDSLLILNLSALVTFLDFGIIYSYFFLLTNSNNQYAQNRAINRRMARICIKIVIIELIAGALLSIFGIERLLGIYVILFALNLPGLMNLIQLRALGKHVQYLLLFNLSWPLSALAVFFNSQMNLIHFNSYFGFLPLAFSILVNTSYLFINRKDSVFADIFKTDEIKTESSGSVRQLISASFLNLTLFAFVTQFDKFLAARVGNEHELVIYLTYGQIFSSLLSVMNQAYLNENAVGVSRKKVNLKTIFLPGLATGLIFILVSYLYVQIFFTQNENSPDLLLFGAINLLLYGILFEANNTLIKLGKPNLRMPGLLIQLLTLLFGVYITRNERSLVLLQIIVSSSIFANILLSLIVVRQSFSRIKPKN